MCTGLFHSEDHGKDALQFNNDAKCSSPGLVRSKRTIYSFAREIFNECMESARQCFRSWDNTHPGQKSLPSCCFHLLLSKLHSVSGGDDYNGEYKSREGTQGEAKDTILNRPFWLSDLWVEHWESERMSQAEGNVTAKAQREKLVLCDCRSGRWSAWQEEIKYEH